MTARPASIGSLAGKMAVVAGGTGRVGTHLVRELLAAGAHVAVPSRSREKLSALVTALPESLRSGLTGIEADVSAPDGAARVRDKVLEVTSKTGSPLHAVAATLGSFVPAPSVLAAPLADLESVVHSYLSAHFMVARTFIPLIAENGAYVSINGPLAFDAMFPGTGLVSIATAAQAMLARVIMKETASSSLRVNELVIYSSFGWGNDDRNTITGEDIGRYVVHLCSAAGTAVRGETIHLKSRDRLP